MDNYSVFQYKFNLYATEGILVSTDCGLLSLLNIKRKIGYVILLLAAIFICLPANAYDFEVDGIYYNKLSNNEVEVTYKAFNDNTYWGDIEIPSFISYKSTTYNVISIGKNAFFGSTGLNSIKLPNSIITIGEASFDGCTSLSKIDIPESVVEIESYAFNYCENLTSIHIPQNVTSLSHSAFWYCNNLSAITVDERNTVYDSRENCNAIIVTIISRLINGCKKSTIPNNVRSIGQGAFMDCKGLTSIHLPDGLNDIGPDAFAGSDIEAINIPNTVAYIGQDAFAGCKLSSITIPNGVTSIIDGAFYGCSQLQQVNSEIEEPYEIETSVFSKISPDAVLTIPLNTKNKYKSHIGWTKNFKQILEAGEPTNMYTLSISSNGNGSVYYNSTTIRNKTEQFTLNEGATATINFTPDAGYRIKSVKLDGADVTASVSSSQYTISAINADTSLEVEFEVIPPMTYTLSIKSTGYGYAAYDGTTVRNRTRTFTVNEGATATVSFTPDTGYRIKSVTLNDRDVTASISNSRYTISGISEDTTLEVEFEAIPVTTYTLSITTTGNGSVTYNGTAVRSQIQTFTVNEGTAATITFSPDNGNSVRSVTLNGTDVTSQAQNNRYAISSMTANATVAVTFEEDVNALTVAGVNYTVTSQTNRTVRVTGGDYGQVLTVPAEVTVDGKTWTVTGIDTNALKGNTTLAAVVWNPAATFTATVSNPNLLLYVKDEQYAPSAIRNVVVNGVASSITLADAASGNGFYCPQAFTARNISYQHSYGMTTGIGESRGWETISLPFDVQTMTHSTKGSITPFASWTSGSDCKPFWLYELTATGFAAASGIKAYTPYIISMPNNGQYDNEWLLNGTVTFAAQNVTIGTTDNVQTAQYHDRTFVPSFQDREAYEGLYALNVNNDYSTNNSGMTEGSRFVLNMRQIHPFEAYMTSASNAPYMDVFEGMTTTIPVISNEQLIMNNDLYDLQGRKILLKSQTSNLKPQKGIYIQNGRKIIIK